MDIRSIKTFQMIVKKGSFQAAAEELNYAQSTVTTHIKNLESLFGVTLLHRGKEMMLTEAGRLLYEKGDMLLKNVDYIVGAMDELVNGESGFIRIGVMEPTASIRFPNIIADFVKRFPNVQIQLHIQSSVILSEMVKRDEIDFAICTSPDIVDDLLFEPLFFEEVVLLLPENNPLAKKNTLELKDLQRELLLVTMTTCPFRRKLEKELFEKGNSLEEKIEISNLVTLKEYVKANIGVAVVPKITVQEEIEGITKKTLVDFQAGPSVGIIKHSNRIYSGKAISYLLELIESTLKEQM